MKNDIEKKIEYLEARLEDYPKGTLTYKTINGKKQPYLQWTENGRSKSRFIKVAEREEMLLLIEERQDTLCELKRLRAYYEKIRPCLADNPYLANREKALGEQYFYNMIEKGNFYVDKTYFIYQWLEHENKVDLITRPRRFGKTLTLSMMECFFSTRFQGRSDLFEDLFIWKIAKYRHLQGTIPVIFTTFAAVKSSSYKGAVCQIASYLEEVFRRHRYLLEDGILEEQDKKKYRLIEDALSHADETACTLALRILCELLYRYHGKRPIVLIDEYDTPITEGYVSGYYGEIMSLMRELFNCTLKTNEYLDRALLTGITRIAKESLFSDLNHLAVHSVTDRLYENVFGFTEDEVFMALKCQDIYLQEQVKEWYDGFAFGAEKHIYNPWSIVNFLQSRQFEPYWADSGGYGLISELFQQGRNYLKEDLKELLEGRSIRKTFRGHIVFDDLKIESEAVWPFLLATGYLRADHVVIEGDITADLSITNRETRYIFRDMIKRWFTGARHDCNEFCKCLLSDNLDGMNQYLGVIALQTISYFDTDKHPAERTPERFYHGFVLGLLVDLREEYEIISNRESGFGRYDIMMRPKKEDLDGIIIEFKVRDERNESSLEETVEIALHQIEEKQYEAQLVQAGVPPERIRKYGFAFEGKEVLIG